jgi:DNA-directed RNA polymerase subunit N (RpoN/RPB10)
MKCNYCGKEFKTNTGFAKHMCKNKEIAEILGDLKLRIAYDLFNFWFRYNGMKKKNEGKGFEEFLKSPYFSIFAEFTERVTSMFVHDSRDFLVWLSDNRIPAKKWTWDSTINRYKKIEHTRGMGLDRTVKTLELMAHYCDKKNIPIAEFFEEISVPEAIRWIESGRLSPWLLLNTASADALFSRMKNDSINYLASILDITYWESRFKRAKDTVSEIKEVLDELGFET